MSKQQLNLAGFGKKRSQVNKKTLDQFFQGKLDLPEALGLTENNLEEMRRQAIAFHGAGKYQECVDLVLGISALGSIHPVDAKLLSLCYAELGQKDAADSCQLHFEEMMRQVNQPIPESLV